jgi:nitroreductase
LRRRLDFDRPVDNQLLLDCIDLAEQAPTGGNLGSRRWIIMRDQEVKDRLGELYRDMALGFMSSIAERLRGTGHPQERVASAEYLAEYLAEVPAIVIPTIIGRHDGSGRPGTELTPAGCADQSLGHVTLTSSSWRPRHWAHYPIIASGNRESPRPGSPAR